MTYVPVTLLRLDTPRSMWLHDRVAGDNLPPVVQYKMSQSPAKIHSCLI